jgi:oligopeptide/dipeptide ABC transporter ATP-binding protein
MTLIEANNLTIRYEMEGDDVLAVDDVTFAIEREETFGLVGESGCGKTTLAKSLMHLLDDNGVIDSGEVWLDATLPKWEDEDDNPRREIIESDEYPVRQDGMTNLAELEEREIRDIRWRNIALIPQSAMNALNPVYKVGDQIIEAIQRHEPWVTREKADERARDLLERVGVDPARADDYAHQFSGGMKQRAVIAMAMACDPDMLIADEPTTALDVVIQDRILDELIELQEDFGIAILVVSHDISVMAEICDKLAVMYAGKMMETGTTEEVIGNPSNPYTLGLTNSFPTVTGDQDDLVAIPGSAPSLRDPDPGCRFVDRCPFAVDACTDKHPPMYSVDAAEEGRLSESTDPIEHRSACYVVDQIERLRTEATEEETWHETKANH